MSDLTAAIVLIISYLVIRTLILYIAAKMAKIENAKITESFLIVLITSIVGYILESAISQANLSALLSFESVFASWLVIRFIGWFISLFIIKLFYRTTWVKAFWLWVILVIVSIAFGAAFRILGIPVPVETPIQIEP